MTIAVAAVVGLLLGSFTNVLIARVPQGRDWVRGASHCPRCEAQIRWYDNVPVLSWVALRGRCRDCGEPISIRYPVVEVLVASLVVASLLVYGISLSLLMLTYLAVVTVALAFIDLDVRRLPHEIVLPSLAIVAALVVVGDVVFHEGSALRALVGLGAMGGFYALLWLIYPKGMGFGDVTTAALLGLVMGFFGWAHLAVGAISGPLLGGVAVVFGLASRRLSRGSAIPYGPFLIAGAWLGVLAGPLIADAYLNLLGLESGV